ncbi:MAG TPA: GspE/PulE family protein [Longimicrobium sp.]|nr:GspE/PulE family protein [Longimicrobium sp.]
MSAPSVAGPDAAALRLDEAERLSDQLTPEWLEEHGVLPLREEGGRMVVATWRDGLDVQALDTLRLLFALPLALARAPEEAVRGAIRRAYGDGAETAAGFIADLSADPGPEGGEPGLDDLVSLANEAPVVKLVNLLLLEALEARASDVHIEGYARSLRVRYRLDGVLQDVPAPPARLMPAVISRLKIMADLDIAERRVPQDGRIRLRLKDRQVDVRVSTLPTLGGESVVLRLLDKERGGRVKLTDLGMAPDTLAAFRQAVARPHGVVLATGPTGSGKTTTLYAAVDHIRTGREKILTVEDPVEYELEGVPQVQVNEKVGVSFATALRALLRQDPDVMLVGEIRDEETASIAIHAALTGHLVLSTLHTNDAPSALTRLFDLGVAPYLVASTVEAVLAQRLVRLVCGACAEAHAPERGLMADFGGEAPPERVMRGRGCPECRGTGYRGRQGVYELLVLDDDVRALLLATRDAGQLRRAAMERGMRTLRMDGLRLVREGLTTPEEVLRVTRG